MATYPLINGVRYDFSSIEVVLDPIGRKTIGVQALSYKNALKPGIVRGTSARKNGRTRGQHEPDASITMYKEEADALIDELGDGYGEVPFDIVVNFADEGQPLSTTVIVGARIVDDGEDFKEGSDALMTKFDLDVMDILKNNKSITKQRR